MLGYAQRVVKIHLVINGELDKFTENYDVIKERSIHHMIILTLLPLAHANVEINTFPMIYYEGFRNQN